MVFNLNIFFICGHVYEVFFFFFPLADEIAILTYPFSSLNINEGVADCFSRSRS